MRSRYSAFVVARRRVPAAHLGTRRPAPASSTRPVDALGGPGDPRRRPTARPFHQSGTVTFVARYPTAASAGSLHERSRFRRHEGAWVYVDGDFIDEP